MWVHQHQNATDDDPRVDDDGDDGDHDDWHDHDGEIVGHRASRMMRPAADEEEYNCQVRGSERRLFPRGMMYSS